jgi:hypothetical protein
MEDKKCNVQCIPIPYQNEIDLHPTLAPESKHSSQTGRVMAACGKQSRDGVIVCKEGIGIVMCGCGRSVSPLSSHI